MTKKDIIHEFTSGAEKVDIFELSERSIGSFMGDEQFGLFMKNTETGKEILISYSEPGYKWIIYPMDFEYGLENVG